MAGPKLEDFAGAIGESWDVDGPDAAVRLRLERADPLPRAVRDEGGFRLEWIGPAAALLPQATYTFRRGGEAAEMFIVPVGREGDSVRYEAIFI